MIHNPSLFGTRTRRQGHALPQATMSSFFFFFSTHIIGYIAEIPHYTNYQVTQPLPSFLPSLLLKEYFQCNTLAHGFHKIKITDLI